MKPIKNRLSSLLGGIAFVFAMMLFMPSAANATWGKHYNSCSAYKHGSHKHGSHAKNCALYEDYAAKYKELAAEYLGKYNKTHCYSHYKYYLCYAKKYNYYKEKLAHCDSSAINCDKYKTTADQYRATANRYKVCADKYLALYNSYHNDCYYRYYLFYKNKYDYYMNCYDTYMEKYNKCQAEYNFGTVHGYIYEDIDKNKQKSADEHGISGVVIVLTDADGKEHNATTDATGRYEFSGVAKGAATVRVTESGLPDGAVVYDDNNPATIEVVAARDIGVADIGYVLPEPTGSLRGKVFEDADESGDFTNGELGAEGIVVTITDKEGKSQSITTTDGTYLFEKVTQGEVDVEVSHLPAGADVTIGSLSFSKYVIANQSNMATDVGYLLPVPTGALVGKVFEDADKDGQYTDGEIGVHGITISVKDSEGNVQCIVSTDGTYRFIGLAEGNAEITVTNLPAGAEVTIGELSFSKTITAGEDNAAADVGYIIKDPVGSIEGTVYWDEDGNGEQNDLEKGDENITISILDADGILHNVQTDNQGYYKAENIAVGVATVTLMTSTLPEGMVYSSGNIVDYVTVTENQVANAGKDAYVEEGWHP